VFVELLLFAMVGCMEWIVAIVRGANTYQGQPVLRASSSVRILECNHATGIKTCTEVLVSHDGASHRETCTEILVSHDDASHRETCTEVLASHREACTDVLASHETCTEDFFASLETWKENIIGPKIRIVNLGGNELFVGRVTRCFLTQANEGEFFEMKGAQFVFSNAAIAYKTITECLKVIPLSEFESTTDITLVRCGNEWNRSWESMQELFADAYDIVSVYKGCTIYPYPRALIPKHGLRKTGTNSWHVESSSS